MSKEFELWQFIADRISKGETAALLIVAKSSGSSPGRVGFKMAVTQEEMCGSIGGGVMEVELVERARRNLRASGRPVCEIIKQVHRSNSEYASGMICSGEQTVILREITDRELDTTRKLVSALDAGSPRIEVTPNEIRLSDGSATGDFETAFIGGEDFCYSELLGYSNELVVVGGGHCALALSELMSAMDFRISLFDDRPNLNTLSKNKFANSIKIIKSYDSVAEFIRPGNNVYVVVMTIGFKNDKVVIRELLDKDFRYFGVLGSNAKMAVLLNELKDEGLNKERLDAIYTPIGLDINSKTPHEIAVSIAAEIIKVKNRGR
jgi:xanthine dehydrogenase accessory factor